MLRLKRIEKEIVKEDVEWGLYGEDESIENHFNFRYFSW